MRSPKSTPAAGHGGAPRRSRRHPRTEVRDAHDDRSDVEEGESRRRVEPETSAAPRMRADDFDRFRAGDDELFARLVKEYSPVLLHYIAGFARYRGDADDLLQDTWTAAYERRLSFRNAGAFRAWLLRVCRSVCLDNRRRLAREAKLLARWECRVPQDALASRRISDAVRAQEVEDLLIDHVMKLPKRQRLSVITRMILGLGTTEAAEVMQCAEGTVKASLHSALINLRRSTAGLYDLLVDDEPGSTVAPLPPALRRGLRNG